MPSLFNGTDQLICDALEIQRRDELKRRSKRVRPLSYEKGHMPEWFNQCPVASGLTHSGKDRNLAVDLIHISGKKARLIELKWTSDTPVHALFQLLEYGLAYVFARLHVRELNLKKRRLMNVGQIGLEVVGPREFFVNGFRTDLFDSMDKAIGKFVTEKTGGALSMSLRAFSFPAGFERIPFVNGKAVKEGCQSSTLSIEGAMIRDAFSRLELVDITPRERFLPGVPADKIERILNIAPGNELESGKFDSPESSSALAVNAFGFFLHRAGDLPLPLAPG